MEQGLRDCCRSIRIGKILVESDADTHEARVVYAKFPDDIAERKILLMYPIMSMLYFLNCFSNKTCKKLQIYHGLSDNRHWKHGDKGDSSAERTQR